MNILLFSRYGRLGASSRLRSFQYLPFLKKEGISVTQIPLFNDSYLSRLYGGARPFAIIITAYFKRMLQVVREFRLGLSHFDLVWIEKELLPWVPYWFESALYKQETPLVVDYDDAIFHKYDENRHAVLRRLLGRKIDNIMRKARLVIVGNGYLAQRAKKAGASWIEIIPTVIDLKRYPFVPKEPKPEFTIGWVGSPTTANYLRLIEPALEIFCRNKKAKLLIVGAGRHTLSNKIPSASIPWMEESEAKTIRTFDVGIMPLPHSNWARGKCGYKLIQYMGCGRPVIASEITAELNMVENGKNGFIADSTSQWVDRLELLYNNRLLANNMGKRGRRLVEEKYDLRVTAPQLKSLLLQATKKRKQYHMSTRTTHGQVK